MTNTNGHGPKTAVLYARVSTDEQARSGYSLAQQIEALREYATREGYEVLEEVSDPGHSGASLERPGIDRVRDLVAAGGVSVVLAQDRDRFAREPAYHYLLKREFEEHGTKIRALSDRGDESPEGELTDGILDQLAKFERAKTAERTRRGKLRKAREGKVIAGSFASYGFRYNAARDGYEVDEDAMEVVRRVFRMMATEGATLHAVKRAFEREGLTTPKGNDVWSQPFLRSLILDDVYKPHTFEEMAALVSPEVATRLDPHRNYGIWWYNKYRSKVIRNVKTPTGYKPRRIYEEKARQEWIAVPIPHAGMKREWVEAAREAIKGNHRPSSAGRRLWELSGGVLCCAECGRRMTTHSVSKTRGGQLHRYFYYVCQRKMRDHNEACANRSHPAENAEYLVWGFVSELLKDPSRLRAGLDRMMEQERDASRGDPSGEAQTWLERLAEADRKRDGYLDLAADGLMSRDELRTKLSALEEARKTAERELAMIRGREERLRVLERDKEALLTTYEDAVPETLDRLTPEERRRIYAMLKLRVTVGRDGVLDVSGVFGGDLLVCDSEPTSTC
jgi:site-specific DNA recombinase